MKFFIIGDSWGVGSEPEIAMEHKNIGIDYYLKKLGHTVTNISANSAGNFGQLRHAYYTLLENNNYDRIIWFHTESIRDIIEICIQDPQEQQKYFPDFEMHSDFGKVLDYVDRQNYQFAQELYNKYHIPFIVIDGQTPMNKTVGDYSFVKHNIPWIQTLLELEVDPRFTFSSWPKIQTILKHYKISERHFIENNIDDLDFSQSIVEYASESDLFPDNSHPSTKCYELLTKQVEELG